VTALPLPYVIQAAVKPAQREDKAPSKSRAKHQGNGEMHCAFNLGIARPKRTEREIDDRRNHKPDDKPGHDTCDRPEHLNLRS
jgi:hypothetical protein